MKAPLAENDHIMDNNSSTSNPMYQGPSASTDRGTGSLALNEMAVTFHHPIGYQHKVIGNVI